ncbi:hypothetical protein [Eisenbergiella sp.]
MPWMNDTAIIMQGMWGNYKQIVVAKMEITVKRKRKADLRMDDRAKIPLPLSTIQ